MPEDTPKTKVANTKAYGGTVLTYDRYTESREEIGAKIAKDQNLTLIKPYDNEMVIAGQGTVGLEIVQQLSEFGLDPDIVAAPCGGGGLLSGISLSVHETCPNTQIYAAEPENFDDATRSLNAGERLSNTPGHRSICDAIVTPSPGELTFPILHNHQAKGVVVSDAEAKNAIKMAYKYFKVVLEPGGAVALAAYLSGKIDINGRIAVAVGSGGNIDDTLFNQIIADD